MRSTAHPVAWRGLCALTLLGLLLIPSRAARAQSAGELRASAREISNEIAAQKSGGSFNAAAQQRAV